MHRIGIIQLLSFALAVTLLQGMAHAELLSGSVELFGQNGDSKTTDSTGLTTMTRSQTFLQRYIVNLDSQFFPEVRLHAGFRYDDTTARSAGDNGTFKTETTLFIPSVTLTFSNPFAYAGVGYERQDEKVVGGGLSTTTYRDTRNAYLGFKPTGLPSLDLLYVGTSWYDQQHKTLDRDENMFQISSLYRPIKSLQLTYSATFDNADDHIAQSDTESVVQNAHAGYNDRFFDDRWMITANVNASRTDAEFRTSATGGSILVQLFPVAGLSSINDTPQLGALSPNPALIDGNLTVSSGINIGQQPSFTGDTKRRNIGVDFGLPVTVSTIYVWVDRPLPSSVANSFTWEIYTSQDNQNWFLAQTVFPANFGQFDNRFEIFFASVTTRYIKVATRPLSVAAAPPPGFDVSNIFITEVQAFFNQTVIQAPGKTGSSFAQSSSIDLDNRVFIIRSERHSLLYDLYYRGVRSETTGSPPASPSILTNALIGYERFSRVFSGSAKVMLENDEYANRSTNTYTDAEASLTAASNSLRKLAHTLTLTGKQETWSQLNLTKDTGTVTFSNTAEVYPGINGYLNAVENVTSAETGTATGRANDTLISIGFDIIPHRSLTISTSYNWDESVQGGSATSASVLGTTGRRTQSTFGSVAYNPFSSLYLFGSIQRTEETGKPSTTNTSLNGSWATQVTGGALEFRLIYSENSESDNGLQSRTYGPYVKYRMTIRASLEATYLISMLKTSTDETDSHTLSTTFRWLF